MSNDGYRVHYAWATYGDEEREAVNEVLDHPERLVNGPYTTKLEEKVSNLFGKESGIMVNSGSSANLLAVELLNLPQGSEVITPIVTFSTTVAPLVQKGLVPVFVDIGVGDYQLNVDQVQEAISENTGAIMVPSLLGNIPDYQKLKEIARENDLLLIEDSADTLGAKINGRPTGEFTDISTTSFYGSHVVTTFGAGGMIAVNNDQWMQRLKKLRGWGRASATNETNDIDKRLETELGGTSYDSKFVFDELGYNFLTTEASAAFGVEQVKKLEDFTKKRRQNFEELRSFFSNYEEWFILPEERDNVTTCWLAFPLTIKPEAPFDRKEIVKYIEKNRIQTRSLWSGNLLKHPGFEKIDARLPLENYPNANKVMEKAFVIGAHESIDKGDLEYIKKVFRNFFEMH